MKLLQSIVRLSIVLFLIFFAVVHPSVQSIFAAALMFVLFSGTSQGLHTSGHYAYDVNTSTYLADAKNIYGVIQDQVSTLAAFMNLLGDGSKFGKISNIGIRGYTFLARLRPNWNLGYRPEGTGGVGTAGAQGLAQATVALKYAYVPITITGQAEQLTKGEGKAFMQAKALEAKFDMKDLISHVNVVMVGAERGGQLAQVVTPAAGSFTADNSGLLPAALFLRNGMPIDCGPVGGGALSLQNATITALNYATRLVTHNGGAATTGHAVYLSGEAPPTAGVFPYTAEGLVSLISDTGSIQGLDPATAAASSWAAYLEDVGSVQLSSQLIMQLIQFVKNRGGEEVDGLIFPSAQINQLVAIATTTLRFDVQQAAMQSPGKRAVDLGFTVFEYAGKPIIEDKDARADRIYAGNFQTMKKFEAVPLSMADDEAGAWTRVTAGGNGIADAVQGLLRWYHQLGVVQRSAWGVQKNYTIPTKFQTLPATL
jgi:hypothetical protein